MYGGTNIKGRSKLIENVQRITVSVTSATQNVTIPATDKSRSTVKIKQISIQNSNSLAIMQYQRATAKFTSDTNIQIQLGSYDASYTSMTIHLEITTYKKGTVKSLQRGSYVMIGATSSSAVLSSVNMSKTIIEASWRTTQSSLGYANQTRAWNLTSGTNLSFYCGAAYPATFEYEVVEFY